MILHTEPGDIEKTSMDIIKAGLDERNTVIPEDELPVVMRVIHTTADFDFAENLKFSEGAVEKGIQALKAGTVIVTDTNMALQGINTKALTRLSSEKICFMADPDVAAEAAKRGITRAAVSVERAAGKFENCIFASGNAPTALIELASQIEKGFRPRLVIAVPVGFVNVTEAKELIWDTCMRYGIPCIAAMGRKGGSTVAAAVCNALIYKAGGRDR